MVMIAGVDLKNLLKKRSVRVALTLLILVPFMYAAAFLATKPQVIWKVNEQGNLTLNVNPVNNTDSWNFTAIRFNITQFQVQGGPVDIRLVDTQNGSNILSYDRASNTTLEGTVYPDVPASYSWPGRYFSVSVSGNSTTATVSFGFRSYVAEDVVAAHTPLFLWDFIWFVSYDICLIFTVTIIVEFFHVYRSGLAAEAVARVHSPLIPCIFLAIVASLMPFQFVVSKSPPYILGLSGLTWAYYDGIFATGSILSYYFLWLSGAFFFPGSFVLIPVLALLYGFFLLRFIRYYYKQTSLIRVLMPLLMSDLLILASSVPFWYFSFFYYEVTPSHHVIPPDPFGAGPLILMFPTFVFLVTAWIVCLYIRKRGYVQKTVTTVKVDSTDLTAIGPKS